MSSFLTIHIHMMYLLFSFTYSSSILTASILPYILALSKVVLFSWIIADLRDFFGRVGWDRPLEEWSLIGPPTSPYCLSWQRCAGYYFRACPATRLETADCLAGEAPHSKNHDQPTLLLTHAIPTLWGCSLKAERRLVSAVVWVVWTNTVLFLYGGSSEREDVCENA